jgi:hypothetical protein
VKHPERVLGKGEHAGFEWMVLASPFGFRCGYTRVPSGHPWYGKKYPDIDACVHGGLTFTSYDLACDAPGPDDGYWVGFDFGHGGDGSDPEISQSVSPVILDLYDFPGSHIWTQQEAEQECRSLCEQARAASELSRT